MSNLVPVVRPDVNGKLVTRHVKAVQAPAAVAALTIPPVQHRGLTAASGGTIEAAKGRVSLLGYITTAISLKETALLQHSQQEIGQKVRKLPDSTVEMFHRVNAALTEKVQSLYLARLVIKALDCGTDPVDIESAIYYFEQSHETARDEIEENFDVGARRMPRHPLGGLINAVKTYDLDGFVFDPTLPIGQQDEHTLRQCDALRVVHYTAELAKYWEPRSMNPFAKNDTLLDTRLAQLVVDRPDTAESISEIIYERETLDCNLIAAILDNEAPALSEGTL